ncbi:hypothetical protein BS47DRAFT_1317435 [Hydnum rufescens UP504]|uniref:AB hydrolase-1 domain-containing protein n=1 Tax=Hydnum rufescens UP504 TaxID=1448309 RepID=A0A9P6AY48_9AGAM|nr:hypothetical protein BS47DRAFT_1317435 [Hydnum rufescens UP504]
MDFAGYGDSDERNSTIFASSLDWIDDARDILNLVENFVLEGPFVASPHRLPAHLHRLPSECASQRRKFGFHDRHVLGVSHSMGGGIIANAACASPNLFQSLILLDPAIISNRNSRLQTYFISALLRRQAWPSRDEARAQFLQNPFFKGWDPEVLDVHIQHGLADIPASEGGGVRLKMSSFQEAVNTIDNHFIQETYQVLEGLDEKVNFRWIMPTVPLHLDRPEYRPAVVRRRLVNSSNVVIDLDHMCSQKRLCPVGRFTKVSEVRLPPSEYATLGLCCVRSCSY